MKLLRGTSLLFGLNLLDALLTLIWVRNGIAGEGNQLMAHLLEIGDFTFLATKLAIGAVTVFVLLKWSYLKLAHYGLAVALAVYIGLMGVHLLTGLSAAGLVSASTIDSITQWTQAVIATFI